MTGDNPLSQLFPRETGQSRTPEATDSPARVELRPILQRRIAAPAAYVFEVSDEPPGRERIETERETKSAPRAHEVPVDAPVKTERIIERVIVEPSLEPSRPAAANERRAPAPKPDRSAVSGETVSPPPVPPRPASSQAQKPPTVHAALTTQSRDESPPVPKPADQPSSVQVQQGPRPEKSADREPPRIVYASPDRREPERKPVIVQPVIQAEPPPTQSPAPISEKAEAFSRAQKPDPPDRTVPVKAAVAPKAERDGEPKIEPVAARAELKPAPPLAVSPASLAEPALTPAAQPQANADSHSSRQPQAGGVTVRIGSIQITSRGKSAQRPPAVRRPARSHKIEPRLPFASGRW